VAFFFLFFFFFDLDGEPVCAVSGRVQRFDATLPSSTRPQITNEATSSPTTLGHGVCDCWRGHGCDVIIGF
jgi:hypothetical protein